MKTLNYSITGDCSLVMSGQLEERQRQQQQDSMNDRLAGEKIRGKFSSKISLLMRHIQHLQRLDGTQKYLIFSQFDTVLDNICEALDGNDIRHVRFKGKARREAVRQFHFDPSTKVFLLHSKTQASGLTLTNASHVFLVEPILEDAVECQAIGRVHRIGQKKETRVYHYYVKNSVEENLIFKR